jgi:hypothetical protein
VAAARRFISPSRDAHEPPALHGRQTGSPAPTDSKSRRRRTQAGTVTASLSASATVWHPAGAAPAGPRPSSALALPKVARSLPSLGLATEFKPGASLPSSSESARDLVTGRGQDNLKRRHHHVPPIPARAPPAGCRQCRRIPGVRIGPDSAWKNTCCPSPSHGHPARRARVAGLVQSLSRPPGSPPPPSRARAVPRALLLPGRVRGLRPGRRPTGPARTHPPAPRAGLALAPGPVARP